MGGHVRVSMEIPDKLMQTLRARTGALRDQIWSDIEDRHDDILRFMAGEDNEALAFALAQVVSTELFWRKANRLRLLKGDLDE
jgi:hypothetical protein